MCGEKQMKYEDLMYDQGSPPRVRGKEIRNHFNAPCTRITPACAGKRCKHCYIQICKRDHPRVCGEKEVCFFILEPVLGSPPRVRGKGYNTLSAIAQGRITPACAGKSADVYSTVPTLRDHPRVCGEKKICIFILESVLGSPPRVRGKALQLLSFNLYKGITPACAGKSNVSSNSVHRSRDHPRVCGEKVRGYVKIWNEWGSPPRVRGKGAGDVTCPLF